LLCFLGSAAKILPVHAEKIFVFMSFSCRPYAVSLWSKWVEIAAIAHFLTLGAVWMHVVHLCALWSMLVISSARAFAVRHAHNALSKHRLLAADFSSWEKWEYGTFPKYPPQHEQHEQQQQQQQQQHAEEEGSAEALGTGWSSGVERAISELTPVQVAKSLELLSAICNSERLQKLQQVVAQRVVGKRVVYEKPANPNNAWAALRTLDSFGIQHVDLIADGKKENPKRWRHMHASLGSQKWLTLAEHDDTKSCLQTLKEQGFKIFVTDVHNRSLPIDRVQWAPKSAIVFGNEFRGVSDEAKALADQSFFIPMRGFAESLNLAAATAVTCSFLASAKALQPDMPKPMRDQVC
jgi:tRNA (guanosine-2'-O-)-methyltransferase